jgi:DNA (cytosine-5)-methyltransferase 1
LRKLPVNKLHATRWMIVDNFAGGGGASTGIEIAVGRSPDVAINHNSEALAMHLANHPETRHYASDVFEIDPQVVVRGRPVGLAWFSPDCTQFSKAKGGKPIREAGKKSRGLAWVVVKWAKIARPRVIMLENVEEWQHWGPLVKTDKGEVPCPVRKGETFRRWKRALERLGYQVELRELRACDFGTPTIRKRLFVICRCDGLPIVWPEPTHGRPDTEGVRSGRLKPWRTAAEILDWSIPCPSIFLTPEEAKAIGVKRPLAENTLKRIAAGLKRYVLDAAKPFIVRCNHGGDWFRGQGLETPLTTVTGSKGDALVMPYIDAYHGPTADGHPSRATELTEPTRTVDTQNRYGIVAPFLGSPAHSTTTGRGKNVWAPDEPITTITSTNDKCVIAPIMTYAQHGGSNRCPDEPLHTVTASTKDQNAVIAPVLSREFGKSTGADVEMPVPTVMPGGQGKTALVQAFLAQHNTGLVGHRADKPLSTITSRGTQQQVVEAAFLSHNYTSNTGGGAGEPDRPLKTVMAGGQHHMAVKAFLQKYYGTGGQHQDCREPTHTVPTKDRLGLVTVDETDYEIVDIGMRMLTSRELFRAQGFPDSYKIDVPAFDSRGRMRPLPKDAQVRMCGNSVCPQVAAALVSANCPWLREPKATTKRERQLEFAGV